MLSYYARVLANAPFKWTDPHTWPWPVWIWVGFVALSWGASVWKWWRRKATESWPTVHGTIDSAKVHEKRGLFGLKDSSGPRFTVELTYSYSLEGQARWGRYERDFDSEAEAEEFVRDLEGRTVAVSYATTNVNRSTLSAESLDNVSRTRTPLPGGREFRVPVADLPPWAKLIIAPFVVLAIAGFVLSVWIHVAAILGHQAAPDGMFFVMHVGIFVVFFPAVFVTAKRVGRTRGKDTWKHILRGAPEWVRYMVYTVWAYGAVSSLLSFPHGVSHKSGIHFNVTTWRYFSVGWMIFYCTSFGMLYAALDQSSVDDSQQQ